MLATIAPTLQFGKYAAKDGRSIHHPAFGEICLRLAPTSQFLRAKEAWRDLGSSFFASINGPRTRWSLSHCLRLTKLSSQPSLKQAALLSPSAWQHRLSIF